MPSKGTLPCRRRRRKKAAALVQSLDRRSEDADSSLSERNHHRVLPYSDVYFTDSTTDAPVSSGNPATASCGGLIDGLHQRLPLPLLQGDRGDRSAIRSPPPRATTRTFRSGCTYVWKDTGSDCSTFTCTGT
jgi:hypothetical protein